MIAILFAGLCTLFITLPIWFYLLYQILVAVNATTSMWVAYFVYIPVALFVSGLGTAIKVWEEK